MTKVLPDPEYLRSRLRYCSQTGRLFWLEKDEGCEPRAKERKRWNSRFAGRAAGKEYFCQTNGLRYYKVSFGPSCYFAHRIIFSMFLGEIKPGDQVDHIDGNTLNNSLDNLRKVTPSNNCQNQTLRSNNKSGRLGVSFCGRREKWVATITHRRVFRTLGYFDSKEQAIEARAKAEIELGFHQNHGRPKCKYS